MRLKDFANSPSGRLVPTIENAQAFVPHTLPPDVDLAKIALPIANAKMAIGELRGASRQLANPYLLIAPLQRREALTSSAMEGTHTTANDLALAEAGIDSRNPETVEVANYVRALQEAVDSLDDFPISHRLIRQAHRTLLTDTVYGRGANKRPGEFKQDQNWIGGATIVTARFVPPPPQEALKAMDALESWINRPDRSGSDILIDMALAHYQFETIHPFTDGNGRIGRLLITLMALQNGLFRDPILYLSPVIEMRKDEYIDRMYDVSARGAWEEWIIFFCEVVEESCKQTVNAVDRLLALKADYSGRVRAESNSSNDIALLEMFFIDPVMRLSKVRERLSLTPQGARNIIDRLIKSGIVKELEGWYPKVFYAPEILMITSPKPPAPPSAS
jgi:Fic family protein